MFSSLTQIQKEIVIDKSGKFVVRACPGSGKTYTVAARMAKLMTDWKYANYQGIAAISFTNVAWKEIEQKLSNNFKKDVPIKYPHFLGTIDSFVNKNIFLPFGHIIMECENRPQLVGEPHGSWTAGRFERDYDKYFDKVSYGVNDELIYPKIQGTFHFSFNQVFKSDGTESQHANGLRQTKKKFWKLGYANQKDANYFSFKILKKYPDIARSLITRFPVFIIDEAQDTSEIQMEIINTLIENGLSEIMIVGDPDQAIFEWNEAKPELFIHKYEDWINNSLELNENRRSSQKICDFSYKISSLQNASKAISNDVFNYHYDPQILVYDDNNINNVIDHFLSECKSNNIHATESDIAILFRSESFINKIIGIQSNYNYESPWEFKDYLTKDILKAKFLIENNDYFEGFKLLENIYIKHQTGQNLSNLEILKYKENVCLTEYRKAIIDYCNLIPSTKDKYLKCWIKEANSTINFLNLKIKDNINDILIDQLFKNKNTIKNKYNCKIGTVHSFKGETFDATLLFLNNKSIGKAYKTLLRENISTKESEELRIVYVGITRPRKLLFLAVPDEENKNAWKSKLLNTSGII